MSRKPAFNAADPDQVDAARRTERMKREQEAADIKALLADPAGRRVLWRLLDHCGVFRSSFTGHGARDAFNEGTRNVGLFLMAEITGADPDAFVTMLKESKQDV